jgi:hypothetical protein
MSSFSTPTPTSPIVTAAAAGESAWPAFTSHLDDDVVIAAVSLVRLSDLCGTPCVHTADAHTPHTAHDDHHLGDHPVSVVIARVLSSELRGDLLLHVTLDADLTGCQPALEAARVIARAPGAFLTAAVVDGPTGSEAAMACQLPADLRAGDVIVIPCHGAARLHDVRRH